MAKPAKSSQDAGFAFLFLNGREIFKSNSFYRLLTTLYKEAKNWRLNLVASFAPPGKQGLQGANSETGQQFSAGFVFLSNYGDQWRNLS